MDDAETMGLRRRAGECLDYRGGAKRYSGRAVELVGEATSLDIFELDVRLAVVVGDGVNLERRSGVEAWRRSPPRPKTERRHWCTYVVA